MNFAVKTMSLVVPFSAAALALAGPANASYAPDRSANASGTSTAQTSAATPAKKAEKQHCMTTEALTGSRLMERKCKTIAEWEALGYEFKATR